MYHYDGQSWRSVLLNVNEGGQVSGAFALYAIHGFAANDIWAVGEKGYVNFNPPPNFFDSSLVIHFDGSSWREVPQDSKRKALLSIGGSSSASLWAGGLIGSLFRFQNGVWRSNHLDSALSMMSIAGRSPSEVYAIHVRGDAVDPSDSISYRFVRFDGNSWARLDSFLVTVQNPEYKFGSNIWLSPASTLYSCGYGVFKWNGGNWERLMYNRLPFYRLRGLNDSNIFAVGDQSIFHWNGSDWLPLDLPINSATMRGVQMFPYEAFIIGFSGGKTLVLHGK
jgi:hypothetical protein